MDISTTQRISSFETCGRSMEEMRDLSTGTLLQTLLITLLVSGCFMLSKSSYDRLRQRLCKTLVVVVGAGPIGLTSVLLACHSDKVSRVLLVEEKARTQLVNRPHQIALDKDTVTFLRQLHVDFDNIEGCWQHGGFFTRIGVFTEYMLDIFCQQDIPVEVKLKTKFSYDNVTEVESLGGRVLVIVCDGPHGHSANLLGLSDEFVQHPCRGYGAVAAVERPGQLLVPTPETRVHNLTFDLNAYDADCAHDPNPQGFHLKIFGSISHRYLALAVPKCETKLVKALRVVLDQSVMRHIFQTCYNSYKAPEEHPISEQCGQKFLKFSPRLFDIRLSHRVENVGYFQETDMFVVAEGETCRCVNFHSGMDVNLGMRGLHSLDAFIHAVACAQNDQDILSAMAFKSTQARKVTQDFVRTGLRETMYT